MTQRSETQERDGAGSARVTTATGRAAASIREGATWEEATEALLGDLPADLQPDLLLTFIDSRFASDYESIVRRLRDRTGATTLAGSSGQAVIGPAVESEERPAISALALALPGAEITTTALLPGETATAELRRLAEADVAAWLVFADPFSTNAEQLLEVMGERHPDVPLLGGLASAQDHHHGTAVFLNEDVHSGGAVLIGLGGAVQVHTITAQGATPIGDPWTITECERNVIKRIGSRPPLEVLAETVRGLDAATQARVQQNLLVGLAMDEYRDTHAHGDFLIRNLVGADQESGELAISAVPRVGQTFQFQLRDATAADDDLTEQLSAFKARLAPDHTVLGAVLCACNGRGRGLFGVPNHDAQAIADAFGPLPTAGLFCNGEIGPVGGRTFLHGFTASIALFTAGGASAEAAGGQESAGQD